MKDVIDRVLEMTDAICDECGNTKTFDICDFYEINQELREHGWIVTKIKGEWVDFCSHECKNQYKEKV